MGQALPISLHYIVRACLFHVRKPISPIMLSSPLRANGLFKIYLFIFSKAKKPLALKYLAGTFFLGKLLAVF